MYTLIWIIINNIIYFCGCDLTDVRFWIVQAIFFIGSFLKDRYTENIRNQVIAILKILPIIAIIVAAFLLFNYATTSCNNHMIDFQEMANQIEQFK